MLRCLTEVGMSAVDAALPATHVNLSMLTRAGRERLDRVLQPEDCVRCGS